MSGPRYLELFAGAGGLSLGLDRAGWACAAHCEIHPDARAVLAARWPDVPLAGDVRDVRGDAFGELLLVSGGSPCQDLSVAGKRAGLAGARSGLYHEQVRVWEESGAPYFLWENVLGALSSNRGADFAAVLSAVVGAAVPVPADGWASAGVVAGPRGVAAWRCLDAQWFGVPQRRRRVFVLGARAGGCDPAAVLLEPEGVRRHPPARGAAGEGAAGGAGGGAAPAFQNTGQGWWSESDVAAGLRTPTGSGSLEATLTLAFHHTQDPISGPSAPRQGAEGMGVLAFSAKDSGADVTVDCAPTLRAGTHDASHMNGGVMPAVLAFDWTAAGAGNDDSFRGGSRRYIVRAGEYTGALKANGQTDAVVTIGGDVTHALTTEGADASEDGTGRGTPIVANCITAREAKGWNPARDVGNGTVQSGIPRRLTPRECERLMDWPDDWTLVPNAKGKPMSDAARYRLCGNGVVSRCAEWIGWRLRTIHAAMVADQAVRHAA